MTQIIDAITSSVALNRTLWTRDFGLAWDSIGLDEKLIWLMFVANTIGIFTLIEYIFLK